jgi:hypothetical protein
VHLGERRMASLRETSDLSLLSLLVVSYILGLVPLAVVGALSRFQAQNSTPTQQVFSMWWLGLSAVIGPLVSVALTVSRDLSWGSSTSLLRAGFYIGFVCFTATPFVGGIVVVMLMLHEYGDCSRIS